MHLNFWRTIVIRAVKDIRNRRLTKICHFVKMFCMNYLSKKKCFFSFRCVTKWKKELYEASIVVICVVRSLQASYKPTIFNFTHTKFSRLIFLCTSHTHNYLLTCFDECIQFWCLLISKAYLILANTIQFIIYC